MSGPSVADRAPAKDAWIERVLGISPGGAVPTSDPGRASPAAALLPVWLNAKAAVDAAISKLQAKMRGVSHPLLVRVADQGLNGVTGRLRVGLQVALTQYDHAVPTDRPQSAAQVETALSAFRTFLDTNRVIPLLEANPFRLPVNIRATLGAALDTIASELRR